MPNHVMNKLYISDVSAGYADTGNAMRQVLDYVRGDDTIFDFNKIIPQPPDVLESLENNEGSLPLWYSWRVQHWGTKWNSYDGVIADDCITFLTAWATPQPIIDALSIQFPDYEFHLKYADEDVGGENCGTYTYVNGEPTDETQEDQQFALDLWGWDEDQWDEDEENNQQ